VKLAGHAPIVAELEANGLVHLSALEAVHPAPMVWTVMVDAGATMAASVNSAPGKEPAIYIVSCLEDGTIVETQWRPTLKLLLRLGPAIFVDDTPGQRLNKLTRRTVKDVLAAHSERLRTHPSRSPAMVWTAAEYVRFRHASYWMIEMNTAVRQMLSVPFVLACALGLGMLLYVKRPEAVVWVLSIQAFVLSVWLFLARLGQWVGGIVARGLPFWARERLALAWLRDEEDE
jgi:hypothetical protein